MAIVQYMLVFYSCEVVSCLSLYIGHTGCLISTRINEHIRHTNSQQVEKSAVAEHCDKKDIRPVVRGETMQYKQQNNNIRSGRCYENKTSLNKESGYILRKACEVLY